MVKQQINLSHIEDISDGGDSQNGSPSKEKEGDSHPKKSENQNDKEKRKKKEEKAQARKIAMASQYAKTVFKFHKFSKNLLRLPEMRRAFHRCPNEVHQMILEKKLDLDDLKQDPYTEQLLVGQLSAS